jgi:hypothetical protein
MRPTPPHLAQGLPTNNSLPQLLLALPLLGPTPPHPWAATISWPPPLPHRESPSATRQRPLDSVARPKSPSL